MRGLFPFEDLSEEKTELDGLIRDFNSSMLELDEVIKRVEQRKDVRFSDLMQELPLAPVLLPQPQSGPRSRIGLVATLATIFGAVRRLESLIESIEARARLVGYTRRILEIEASRRRSSQVSEGAQ